MMASSAVPIDNLELCELLKYNEMLFKELLPAFTPVIPAVELLDLPCINSLLTNGQMQKVKKKEELDGNQSAARELLELLHSKPRFFDAILEAMAQPTLKLASLIPDFKKIKDKVDKAWFKKYHSHFPDQNRSSCTDGLLATAASEAIVGSGVPLSDFRLAQQALDQSGGMQVDADLEDPSDLERNNSSSSTLTVRNNSSSSRLTVRNNSTIELGEQPVPTRDVENYTDARSDRSSMEIRSGLYASPNPNPSIENPYTGLTLSGLCVDATPEPTHPVNDRVGSAHVAAGGQAEPSRDTHPSLKNAISNKPEKDFSPDEVVPHLRSVSGWHQEQVEQKVIQIIKPHRQQEGSYIIWYWAMAKRPTICAVLNKKVITFVVHKTSRRPVQYFINKNQRRDEQLKALVEYHIQTGIAYKPVNGNEVTVYLTHPISAN